MDILDGEEVLSDAEALSDKKSTNEFLFGVGAAWNITDRWSVRLDYQRLKNDADFEEEAEELALEVTSDIDLFSHGVFSASELVGSTPKQAGTRSRAGFSLAHL